MIKLILCLMLSPIFFGECHGAPYFLEISRFDSGSIHESDHPDYTKGRKALRKRQWEAAVDFFSNVIRDNDERSDAAMYWKAYALNKLDRYELALKKVLQLQEMYPDSRWARDGKTLEIEIRQNTGQSITYEPDADEESKMAVLNAMLAMPDMEVQPILMKLLDSDSSIKLKKQALFILSRHQNDASLEKLAETARNERNLELQAAAINYLGILGDDQSMDILDEIFKESSNERIQSAVLNSFFVAQERDRLHDLAGDGDTHVEIRKKAIEKLGLLKMADELKALFSNETDMEIKEGILTGLFLCGEVDTLFEIARNEKSPELRSNAIVKLGLLKRKDLIKEVYLETTDSEDKLAVAESIFLTRDSEILKEMVQNDPDETFQSKAILYLGLMGRKNTEFLKAFYQNNTSSAVKKSVINALFVQRNETALIDLFKQEADKNMQAKIVQYLGLIKSKTSLEFLTEILEK